MPLRNRTSSTAIVAFTCVIWPFAARAQAEPIANELFDRGLSQMEAGDFERGCPALRESLRLAPRNGTVFTVAECEARWGRTASALAHYDEYVRRFEKMTPAEQRTQRARDGVARRQLAELKRSVPHLVVRCEQPLPAAAVLTIDGLEIGTASLGQSLPVDPGTHLVRVRGAGVSFEEEVVLEAARTVEIVVAVQRAAPAPAPIPARAASAPPVISFDAGPRRPAAEPWSSRGTVAWVLAGGGALATLGGLALGAFALRERSTIDEHCSGHTCDAAGKAAADRAQSAGLASTVVTSAGVASLGVAAVLWLTAPRRPAEGARVSVRPTAWSGRREGFAGLEGSFQ